MDEKRVDEVQRALVLLHLLGCEVFQPLKILKHLLLWPQQVFHQCIGHLIELSVWREGRVRTAVSRQDLIGVGLVSG